MGLNVDTIRFGRKIPTDWEHVIKYPFMNLAKPVTKRVERVLPVPYLDSFYDQKETNGCVGLSSSRMMSFYNRLPRPGRLYDGFRLWQRAKAYDGDSFTVEGDTNGTYVNAAFKVLAKEGHWLVKDGVAQPVDIAQGIKSYYWAKSVDDIRTSISIGRPVVLGINWYSEFMNPDIKIFNGVKEWWIGNGNTLGYVAGGHAILLYGASDKREGFKLMNTWGEENYPRIWISYAVLSRLLSEDGEACVAIDLPT